MKARTRAGPIAPSPPNAASSPTFTPSSLTAYCLRVSSIVGVGVIATPGASRATMNRRSPLAPTTKKSAVAASSTKSFSPRNTYPPPADSGSSVMSSGDQPAPASQSASVPRCSPEASGASQRSFCASVAAVSSAIAVSMLDRIGPGISA